LNKSSLRRVKQDEAAALDRENILNIRKRPEPADQAEALKSAFKLTANSRHVLSLCFCKQLYQPAFSSPAEAALAALTISRPFTRWPGMVPALTP
jgi:hypothetical protein